DVFPRLSRRRVPLISLDAKVLDGNLTQVGLRRWKALDGYFHFPSGHIEDFVRPVPDLAAEDFLLSLLHLEHDAARREGVAADQDLPRNVSLRSATRCGESRKKHQNHIGSRNSPPRRISCHGFSSANQATAVPLRPLPGRDTRSVTSSEV